MVLVDSCLVTAFMFFTFHWTNECLPKQKLRIEFIQLDLTT